MIVYVVLALGWRSVRHFRSHGDFGWRLSATTSMGRLAGLVMTVAQAALGLVVAARRGPVDGVATFVAVVVFGVGLAIVTRAQATMGASWRVGTDPAETTALVTDGAFRRVRNPIFSGMTLCLAGIALTTGAWAAAVAVAAFIVGMELQVRFVEEPYLRRVHPDTFIAYERRTGRFVP